MNVCVVGLWHLGTVTAACLASRGHDVTGVDYDAEIVRELSTGTLPVFEPGLEELVSTGVAQRRLRFSTDVRAAVGEAKVVWIAYDTLVDDQDRADVEYVVERTRRLFPYLQPGTLVLVSSQIPVGTTRLLEETYREASGSTAVRFAYSPENLRLGNAISAFTEPDRVIVGARSESDRHVIEELLAPLATRIEWMSVESAEMTKHALNAFLATSVSFINEVAVLCERLGADAMEVARGLKSEARIGPKAYLSPGAAFAGGTLARDVMFLSRLGELHGVPTHLLSSVKESNDLHRRWAARRLDDLLGNVAGEAIGIWGLTYKAGTDTLRRSSAVELAQQLCENGAIVRAYDPAVRQLPEDLCAHIHLAATALEAIEGASALVVATPWPEYRQIHGAEVSARMKRGLVLDANRFLSESLGGVSGIEYISVGKAGA